MALASGSQYRLDHLAAAEGDEAVADFGFGGIAEAVEGSRDQVGGLDFSFHGEGGVPEPGRRQKTMVSKPA